MDFEMSGTWKELIKPIFPPEVNIVPIFWQWNDSRSSEDLAIMVNWKLRNDPERPNKPSRNVMLILPREFLEDFYNLREDEQADVRGKVESFVRQKYKNFDPEPGTPKYAPPLEETWIIPSNLISANISQV